MKFKIAVIASLVLATSAAQADWLKAATDSVKGSVTDSVKQTTNGAKEAAYDSAVSSALGLVAGKTDKAYVTEKLGQASQMLTEDGAEVWSYDVSALQQTYPVLTEVLKQYPQVPAAIQLSFKGDIVNNIKMIKPAA
jgi:outer membrane lipoprotein-sorting protein